MLDRIVGYKISPVLWAKVKRGLSAGRVQSVALRIIADREDEIAAFIPEEYWSLDANFKVKGEKKPLTAKFYGTKEDVYKRQPDALIIADPGVFEIAKEVCPEIERHVSTQANNTNYATYMFWYRQGASRVVSARCV